MVLNSFDECEIYLSACNIKFICTWIQIISKLDPLCSKGSSQSLTVMGKTIPKPVLNRLVEYRP